MNTYIKDGVEVKIPEVDENTKVQMERCAEFLARMIEKYSDEIDRLQTDENTTY